MTKRRDISTDFTDYPAPPRFARPQLGFTVPPIRHFTPRPTAGEKSDCGTILLDPAPTRSRNLDMGAGEEFCCEKRSAVRPGDFQFAPPPPCPDFIRAGAASRNFVPHPIFLPLPDGTFRGEEPSAGCTQAINAQPIRRAASYLSCRKNEKIEESITDLKRALLQSV